MDLPSIALRIQVEETQFRGPVSESLSQKLGGTMNFLLDNYAIPPGSVFDFAAPESTVPSGWIVCDGRAVGRSTYPNLFSNIGTYWGIGDGITTFNVPDLRGMFTRMVDLTVAGQAGIDPDHASRAPKGTGTTEQVGSYQGFAVENHFHLTQTGADTTGGGGTLFVSGSTSANILNTGAFGESSETRPRNAYVTKIIKT